MASADSTENLPTATCGKRSIKDVAASETDDHVTLSQKRLDCIYFRFLLQVECT